MNRNTLKLTALIFLAAFILVCSQADVLASTGKVKAKETHQTMAGFGASLAFYENWLTAHPYKIEIYDYIFSDLGLDILRIRNIYRGSTGNITSSSYPEIVNALYERSAETSKLFLSSWTPPFNLKSTNSLNGGTLKKVNGQYVYGDFAKYWVDALNAYKANGIEPDYISIQNEPTFETTGYETCRFDATENPTRAGYDRALDSVYYAFQAAAFNPKILAAEVHGIGYNTFQNYALRFNHNLVDGYAYHLYHGESDNVNDNHNPDLFIPNLSAIARSYASKPIFQTEYDRGDWLNTVWLMHNCLVHGSVSAYFYWALAWTSESGKGLVRMEFPWDRSRWQTPRGYILPIEYWAFRQFSKFIDAGWKRVSAEVDASTLRISAFINPEGNKLTIVVVNVGTLDEATSFEIQDFDVTNGQVIRTSEFEQGEEIDGNYDGVSVIEFPGRSITTLSLSGAVTSVDEAAPSAPFEFSLSQNYPNPFNPTTSIEYSIAQESFVQLKIYDLLGREIKTLVHQKMRAGKHAFRFEANDLASGVYLYQLKAGDFLETKRMILIR